jgi:hypothetical protein
MAQNMKRADFMKPAHKQAMGNKPRRHDICKELTGVARPGKTRKDKKLSPTW